MISIIRINKNKSYSHIMNSYGKLAYSKILSSFGNFHHPLIFNHFKKSSWDQIVSNSDTTESIPYQWNNLLRNFKNYIQRCYLTVFSAFANNVYLLLFEMIMIKLLNGS